MSNCRPLVGYENWSELCRQPLLWLGLPDPTGSVFEAMADDPDRDTLDRQSPPGIALLSGLSGEVIRVSQVCFYIFDVLSEIVKTITANVHADLASIIRLGTVTTSWFCILK